jgi:hypothetical protein
VTNTVAPALDEMATITKTWREGGMDNADYGQRIDAFWSHVVPSAAA